VPGYEIQEELGRGGMGVVYKARHLALNRLVALKMILNSANAGREALARFHAEAEVVARLHHPNIVQIYEVGAADGCPFLALELVEGGNLHRQLDGNPQPPESAARMMEVLARAMHHAHQQGVVHRDLKPGNVLLDHDGTPKITDFGLAKRLEHDQTQTASEAILGTPTYMAPEQAAGKTREVGPAADVYALGAVFYDLLTGRPPLRGTTVMDTLQMVLQREPLPPRRLQPSIPLDLQTICLKCLEKDPARRYASALHLAEDLARFLEGRPIAARPTPAWERAWKWARRRPVEAMLAVVCVGGMVGLLAGLVVYADQQRELRLRAEEGEELARQAEQSAELARREADARRADAVKQQALLEQSNDRTRRAMRRAQDNLIEAQDAVHQLIEVSQRRLPDEPHLVPLRQYLLETALGFCERFRNQDSANPAVLLQAARTWRLVGDMQEALGRHPQALGPYANSAGLYGKLLRTAGNKSLYRAELAGTHLNWAVVELGLGQDEAAERSLAQARKLLEPLVEEFPREDAYRRDLALCWNNEGILAQRRGHLPRARRACEAALERFAGLSQASLRLPSVQRELARTQKNLGALLQMGNDPDGAEKQYRSALDRLLALVRHSPESVATRKELGQVAANLAVLLIQRRREAQAEIICDQAVALYEDLTRKFGALADCRHLLALNLATRGEVRQRRGAAELARADLEAAQSLLDRLHLDFPDLPGYAVDLARTLNRLAVMHASASRPLRAGRCREDALTAAEDALARDPDNAVARQEMKAASDALVAWYDSEARRQDRPQTRKAQIEALRRLGVLRQKQLVALRAIGTPDPTEESRLWRDLARTRLTLAGAAVLMGDHEEATRALAALSQPGAVPPGWDKAPRAAGLAARCLDLIEEDRGLSAAQKHQRKRQSVELALGFLRRAAQRESGPPTGLFDAAALAPLRGLPEFQALRAKWESGGPLPRKKR
jgi:tetratricopeptide (TPR) repeat protein/tRNA A-37 threonylcarbamoyl transferase component Bud32